MSGNTRGVDPPEVSPWWHDWFSDFGTKSPRNGGGCGYQQRILIEGLEDFNRTLCALGALIENIAVSLGVEIEGGKSPSATREGQEVNPWAELNE